MRAPLSMEVVCWRVKTWWKTSQPYEGDWKRKSGENENILALWRSWWVSKDHVFGKKPPNLVMRNWEGKPETGINQWKTSRTRWRNMGRKLKDHRYFDKQGKEKQKFVMRRGTWVMRDLVRIRCCIVLQKLNRHHAGFTTLSTPGRQISGYLLASGSRSTLTRISLCRLFFIASLGVFLSTFCWSTSFLLKRPGGLECWSSH